MSTDPSIDRRRRLPAIGRLLEDPILQDAVELYGRGPVRVQARRRVDALRAELDAEAIEADRARRRIEELPRRIAEDLARGPIAPLRRVINATGVHLHTNLGRSPLDSGVVAAVAPLLDAACDLEIDLATGRRDDRNRRAAALLRHLTGAEAALVTNNNAAAMFLALSAVAAGREVVVSRGELVEIGGSFRIPDILEAAGARLVEVGTTNRTRAGDYRAAIGESTALLLKVHPSNFKIRGFTAEASAAELVALGREADVPVMVDEGSGLLDASALPQLREHPSLARLVADGCDLVSGSGDKILGGPQAGLLLGSAAWIDRCRRHPVYRAVRPGRFVYAALDVVLRRRLTDAEAALRHLTPPRAEHRVRLEALARRIDPRLDPRVEPADALLGGGSAPDEPIPGDALSLAGDDALLEALRLGRDDIEGDLDGNGDGDAVTPVVGYLRDGRLWLDLRTVAPGDDSLVARALDAAVGTVGTVGRACGDS